MALILLRHTTPDVLEGVCYGRTDLALAESFGAEAHEVLNTLPEIASIVSSPLRRCQQLAEFIGHRRGLRVEVDERLTEMDFGHWEGRPWKELPRSELDAWADDFMDARPHGGESVRLLKTRVDKALLDYQNRNTGDGKRDSLLVTHAGVIKAAFAVESVASSYDTHIAFGGCRRYEFPAARGAA